MADDPNKPTSKNDGQKKKNKTSQTEASVADSDYETPVSLEQRPETQGTHQTQHSNAEQTQSAATNRPVTEKPKSPSRASLNMTSREPAVQDPPKRYSGPLQNWKINPQNSENPSPSQQQQQQQSPIQQQPNTTKTSRSSTQSQIPVIILMRRDQRQSFNPFLFPIRRYSGTEYETVRVGRDSTRIICPVCRERILTMVVMEPKHPRCLITFLLLTIPCCCCCWPCVCLPYCMDSCQNANHYCPNCNAYVGTFEN